jgi:hypothetical protein
VIWDKVSPEQLSRYNNFVSNNLPHLSPNVISCTDPTCTAHLPEIDSFLVSLQQCLTFTSQSSFTYLNSSTMRRKQKTIPGWNDAARSLKSQANFWYRLWIEAGCPSSGVLHSIKKSSKSRFKYEMRRLKRREHHLRNEKFVAALAANKN